MKLGVRSPAKIGKSVLVTLILLLYMSITMQAAAPAFAASVISQLSDPSGDVPIQHAYVDCVEAWVIEINPSSLQFEMRLRSTVPPNPAGTAAYLWLVDVDRNPNTGQRHVFVGSEYNIRVAFYQGHWQGYVDAINPPYVGGRIPVFVDGDTVTTRVALSQIGGAWQFTWEVGTFDDSVGDSAESYALAQVSPTPPNPGVISDAFFSPTYLALSDGVTKVWPTSVVARDTQGNPVAFSSIKFFADNPSSLSISATGEVEAAPRKFGYCWITAKIDGMLSSNHIDARIGSMRLLPPILLLSVLDNPMASLTLEIRDAAGDLVFPDTVQFSSSNPSVATVSDDGVVTAMGPPQNFGSTPYISAEADGIPANNAAVVRVTQTTLGLTLDAFAAEHLTFYVPRQPISGFDYEQIFRDWDVVRIADIAYELEHEATGIYPFQGDMQFLVNDPGHGADETVPCGLSGNPVRLGTDVDKPVHNSCMIVAYGSGTPQWGVFFHEIGHNFLGEGTKISQFMSGHGADFVYSEGLATALGMYVAKMLKDRSMLYGISQGIVNNIQSSVWHFGSTPDLDAYVAGGASYSQMTPSVLDDMIDVILSKYGYRSLYGLFSVFLPRDVPYPFQVTSDADQATVFVAALSSATGTDLRSQFRQWGFPIEDTYYSSIWSEVNQLVNQRFAITVQPATRISYNAYDSLAPSVAASGSYIYVAWADSTPVTGSNNQPEIWLRASSNSGASFGPPIRISYNGYLSEYPSVAAGGSYVYVAWADYTPVPGSGSYSEVWLRASSNYGASFGPAIRISTNAYFSGYPSLAAVGSYVYVAWQDSTPVSGSGDQPEIWLRASSNGGASFGSAIRISTNNGASAYPSVAAVGSFVHVAWQDNTPVSGGGSASEIWMRVSSNNGGSFGSPIRISTNVGISETPSVAAVGSYVYVAWDDRTSVPGSGSMGYPEIWMRVSSNNGGSFGSAIRTSTNAYNSYHASVDAFGTYVYVAWADDTPVSHSEQNDEIWLRVSSNNGASFGSPIRITTNVGLSMWPSVAASGSYVYVAWQDNTVVSGNGGSWEIWLRVGS